MKVKLYLVIRLCSMSFSKSYNEIFKMVVPAEVLWRRLKTLIFLFAISPFVAFNFSFSRVELYFDTFSSPLKRGTLRVSQRTANISKQKTLRSTKQPFKFFKKQVENRNMKIFLYTFIHTG